MDAPSRWSGFGPAAAWWLVGGPLLFVLGSLTPSGFSPTNMYQHGLFGLLAWSVAVVPAAVCGILAAGRLATALGAGWGITIGLIAAGLRGGHLNSWPLGLEALTWLLILPAGALCAVRIAERRPVEGRPAGLKRGVLEAACWSLIAAGIVVWMAAHFWGEIRP
ncbi:MAG: hypothetical protein KJ621_20950 [Proteobacteria bacterium]|nr:hypothetical protein [Pseudomonadota bacterium]MBU1741579.1 hypothetical protein [Pseudomonadota bacterium]